MLLHCLHTFTGFVPVVRGGVVVASVIVAGGVVGGGVVAGGGFVLNV